ncbi:MAG: hypothetical protein ACOC29_00095 [Candidatus Sumerlaeota bacterium]
MSRFAPDETLLYAEARDFSELQAMMNRTGPGRLWQDPAFQKLIEPLASNFNLRFTSGENGEGPPVEELKQTFTGGGSIFLSELIFGGATQDSPGYRERNTGFMLEFQGESEKVKNWIERYVIGIDRLPGTHVRNSEEFRGVTIYTTVFRQKIFEVPEGANLPDSVDGDTTLPEPLEVGTVEYHYEYAFVDNLCIVLEGQRAFMKKVLGNYFEAKDGGVSGASLAGTEGFRLAFEPVRETADLVGYVNLERLVKIYSEAGALQRFASLELQEFRSACAAVRLTPREMLTDLVVVAQPQPSGLASLFVDDFDNRFATRRLAPRDAVSYSSFWMDPEALYQHFSSVFFGAQGREIIETQLEQRTGLRLREDLLEPLQGEIGSYMRLNAQGEMKSVFLIVLERPLGYADTMAEWIRFMYSQMQQVMELRSVDYMGYPVYSWALRENIDESKLPENFQLPSTVFTVAGGCLILGEDEGEVRYMIRSILESGDSIDRNSDFGRAVAELEPGYQWLMWKDLAKTLDSSLKQTTKTPFAGMFLSRFFNMNAMPDKETLGKYLGSSVSGFYSSRGRSHYHNEIKWPAE